MKNKYWLFLSLLLLFACVKDIEETVELRVVNELDNLVRMEFYSRGLPSGAEVTQINGCGLLFEGSETDRLVVVNQILDADSIIFVFDNQSIQTHLLGDNVPLAKRIFDQDSYTKDGDIFVYTVDNQNLMDSTPCEGGCR